MSDGMLLRLTRTNGESVSINAGALHSVEDIDGHTVIVCSDDVYHIKENRKYVEDQLNIYLEKIVVDRLARMEADPSWARVFREEMEVVRDSYTDSDRFNRMTMLLYKELSAEYAMYEKDRMSSPTWNKIEQFAKSYGMGSKKLGELYGGRYDYDYYYIDPSPKDYWKNK